MVTPPGIPDEKVKKMKPSFRERYGDRWKEVLYATLWKHKGSYEEETQLDEDTKSRRSLHLGTSIAGGVGAVVGGVGGTIVGGPVGAVTGAALGGAISSSLAHDISAITKKIRERKNIKKEETLQEAKKGWNDQGEDYLDFSDEEQQGLQQAIKKDNRDRYSSALRTKFDKIATPGKRGPTDPKLLDIIHKFAVRRNNLLKGVKEDTIEEAKKGKLKPGMFSTPEAYNHAMKYKADYSPLSAKRSWNSPEVQKAAAKYKKEQRGFDSGKREINRLKRQGK